MKKLFILILLIISLFCSCSSEPSSTVDSVPCRFVEVYHCNTGFMRDCLIILDTQTGNKFLFVQSGYAGGLTLLDDCYEN